MVSQQNRGAAIFEMNFRLWFVFCQTHKCSVVVYCQFSSSYDRMALIGVKGYCISDFVFQECIFHVFGTRHDYPVSFKDKSSLLMMH